MGSIEDQSRHAIDGLRGAAAIFVIMHHFCNPYDLQFASSTFKALCHNGGWAVSLFFCISGMIVFESFERHREVETRPRRNFAIRRFFRIMPLYWLLLGLLVLFRNVSWSAAWKSGVFLFVLNGYPPELMPIYQAWTLPIEELFYLSVPLFFRKITSLSISAKAFFFFFALSVLWTHFAAPIYGIPVDRVIRYPFAHIHFFLIGIVISSLRRDPVVVDWFQRHRLAERSRVTWIDLAALAFFVAPAVGIWLPSEISVTLTFLAALESGTLINKICRTRMLRSCGLVCYSMYIIHCHLIVELRPIENWFIDKLPLVKNCAELRLLIWMPPLVFATWIVCRVSALVIEKPAQKLGEKLISVWEQDAVTSKSEIDFSWRVARGA